MLAVVGREDGAILAEYLTMVVVLRKGDPLGTQLKVFQGEIASREMEAPPIEAHLVPSTQEWRIVPVRDAS